MASRSSVPGLRGPRQIAARRAKIRKAPCPRERGGCGAAAGEPCRLPSGATTVPHGARRLAAAELGLIEL
jgi:hypothetical protein